MSNGRPLQYYLGIQIEYDRTKDTMKLNWKNHIENVLEKFSMKQYNATKTPMGKALILPIKRVNGKITSLNIGKSNVYNVKRCYAVSEAL